MTTSVREEVRCDDEIDRVLGLGDYAAVLNILGIYDISLWTLTELRKRCRERVAAVQRHDVTPANKSQSTECANRLLGAMAVAEDYVYEKIKLVPRLTASHLPIPPALCFFVDVSKQPNHLLRMLKWGWDIDHFYFIDVNATDSEEEGTDVV